MIKFQSMEILIITFSILLTLSFIFNMRLYRSKLDLKSRLSQSKIKQEKLLGESSEFSELGLISAGFIHEISNPLTVIIGKLTILKNDYRNPTKQKQLAHALKQISDSAQSIERTIQNVRTYINRDVSEVEVDLILSDLLNDVSALCGQRLRNHGIELRQRSLAGIMIRGRKGQIEQAMLNLITNSFDAIDGLAEKWIEISAVEEKDVVDIYFKDSGPGISKDVVFRMMDSFFTTKKPKGSGLGLSLVQSIAKRHGGALSYISSNCNTTFLLELPKMRKSF